MTWYNKQVVPSTASSGFIKTLFDFNYNRYQPVSYLNQQSDSTDRIIVIKDVSEQSKVKQPAISIQIYRLDKCSLNHPLSVVVEPDKDYFLASQPDLPLYGLGEDIEEAIKMLKREIESLWKDLQDEDDLDEEWTSIKSMLKSLIISYEK